MELKTLEAWTIEPQYKSVPGVADDSGFGGGTMQYQVLLDPVKVAGTGLSVQQVQASLSVNNSNSGGGFYSQGGQFYYVRGQGRIETPADIGNVVLAVHNGTPILVKDVRSRRHRHRAAAGRVRLREAGRRGGRRHPAAHGREGAGRAETGAGEDEGTQRTDPAQGT